MEHPIRKVTLIIVGAAVLIVVLALMIAWISTLVDLSQIMERQVIGEITLGTALWLITIAAVAVALERIISRYLSGFARHAHLEPNVANSLILTFRLLILFGAVSLMIKVGGLPTDLVVTFSALGGAAVGFASTKTIGNFIAGLYLLAARPFKVGDYVRIGTVEGIVAEMSINYTKIQTIGNNVVSISNLQVMDRDIANYAYNNGKLEHIYCYTFEIAFDHTVPATTIAEIFNEVFERYAYILPKRPSYMLLRSGGFERVYMVYIYVEHPQDVFTLRPQIAEEVFKRWDIKRAELRK
ncbi:MAG: mechanosensitive ion channel [Candidatus Bathyarchaeia archaeon]